MAAAPLWLACMLTRGAGVTGGSAQTPLSFRDALDDRPAAQPAAPRGRRAVERSRSDRAAERGLYFPTVSAIGGYLHMNDRLFVDLNDLRPLLSALNPAVPIPPLTATVLENDPVPRQPDRALDRIRGRPDPRRQPRRPGRP